MGTTYKGDTKYFRSIGQNVLIVSRSYTFKGGYFGTPSSGSHVRNIVSADNLQTAIDFYNKISLGGKEVRKYGGRLNITTMADRTVITMRKTSSSDGTPAIDINIDKSQSSGGVKRQKIHFVKEG